MPNRSAVFPSIQIKVTSEVDTVLAYTLYTWIARHIGIRPRVAPASTFDQGVERGSLRGWADEDRGASHGLGNRPVTVKIGSLVHFSRLPKTWIEKSCEAPA